MNTASPRQPLKRRLLSLVALWPWVAGCSRAAGTDGNDPLRRFRGIGIVLVVDAVPGADLERVKFYDDRGIEIYGSSLVAKRNREILSLGGSRVPLTVRVMWREGAGWDKVRQVWNEGTVIGDYTIPVAERIPEAVLADIRAHRGALRLKFRLKPDGLLFGWDIERDGAGTGHVFRYDMPGGDFLETHY
jgi:hypothetical protein